MTTSLGLRPPTPNPGLSPTQASGSKAENNSGFQTVWRWPEDKYEQRTGSIHVVIKLGIKLFPSTSIEDFTSLQSSAPGASMSPIVQMRQLRWVATGVDLTSSNPR